MKRTMQNTVALLICWLMGLLVMALFMAACGSPTPVPEPASAEPMIVATSTAAPTVPTMPLPIETSTPDTTELQALVVAGLPPTPTPAAGGEADWGDVAILPLDTGDGEPPLWAAFTVGMGFYDWEHGHVVAIYTYDDEGWQLRSQTTLTDCAQYVNVDSLRQVEIGPGQIWLELESYTGAHGGCYDLLRFDGETLHHKVSHFNSSPGAGNLADLDGDGVPEVILNWTENYVFCYACGVRLPMYDVLRWNGNDLAPVELSLLPEAAPSDQKALNDRAVELARAELWKDAQAAIGEALALDIQDTNLLEMVTWNSLLIDLHADARAEQAQGGAYPLLDNVFYGDYAAAVDVMRPYSLEQIWELPSPLIDGTPAEGWEVALSDWISWTTRLALEVEPDLAPAHFLRGWAIHLIEPDNPEVAFLVERASELDPDDVLFAESLDYLGGSAYMELPEPPSGYELPTANLCYDLGQMVMQTLQVTATIQEAPFTDYARAGSGVGCLIEATGTGADFESPWKIADDLRAVLDAQDWFEDILYLADGPTGTAAGFWRDDHLCLLSAGWQPEDEADCPADQPISECELEPEQQWYTIGLHCARAVFGATPQPTSTPLPTPTPTPTPKVEEDWEVRTLLAGPGSPGRLYALLTEMASGAWPAERVRFVVSDDYGQTWFPFPGGLPAGAGCIRNVNLDYAPPGDALYASTCQGLYRWTGGQWALLSPQETGMVAIVYGQPQRIWATGIFQSSAPVIRSSDGGATWVPASDGLIHFNGVANLGIDPRDANTLYAVIWPKYAGSYLRRGNANGQWQTMPTPRNNSQIDTGITIDGATGALYVTSFSPSLTWQLWRSLDPRTPDVNAVQWELVHDFGPDISWATLLASGWSPDGLALYANLSSWVDKSTGEVGPPALHRSLDGGQTWASLLIP